MCIIIEQVNKHIAICNCKLAKSQKETTTNNRSGHARQRGAQRSRSQSSHLFCYCYSHSAPQCMSCPLHRICVLRPQINDFASLPTGRTYIRRRLHNQLHANPPGDLGCSYARATSSGIRHDCAGPPLCVVPTFCAVCITNCMRIHQATWVVQMQEARHLGFAMIVQVLPCACTYILSRLHNQSHVNPPGDLGHSHATGRRTWPPLPPRISRRQQISLTNHTFFACLRQVWF